MAENQNRSRAMLGNQNAAGPHGIASRSNAILSNISKEAAVIRDSLSKSIHTGLQAANDFAKSANQKAIVVRDNLMADTNKQVERVRKESMASLKNANQKAIVVRDNLMADVSKQVERVRKESMASLRSANQKAIVVRDGLMSDASKQINRARQGAKDFSQKVSATATSPGAVAYALKQKFKKGADGKSLASAAETASMNLREARGLKMKSEAGAKAAMDKYMAEAPPLRKLPPAPLVKLPPKPPATAVEVYSAEVKRVKAALSKAGGEAGKSIVKAAMSVSGKSSDAAQKMRDRRAYTKE